MSWPPGPALLFCPADRPERFAKAAAVADVVLLDLEDGVAAADKRAAREALRATPLDPARTVVRVNPAGTPEFRLDLETLAETDYTTVMLAKTESAEQVALLAAYDVVALCETPAGVLAAAAIAEAQATVAVMWGAEDLIAGLGGRSSRHPDGAYRDVARHARASVLLAAGAAGKVAIDAVHLDIADREGLAAEVEDAVSSGFSATACIHPSQVDVVRTGYRPSEQQLAWARRVLAAAASERGVFSLDGQMIDAPVLRHADAVVARSTGAPAAHT